MIRVTPVGSHKELKQFVRFKNELYKNSLYAVPALVADEMATLNPRRNPASEFCDFQCFLAYNERGEVVGRIAAIINHRANETWNKKEGRFGFFDFIEEFEVAAELMKAAEMEAIHGPLGFTDMDEEGLLIEGFEEEGTMATLYNYPYYRGFIERLGYAKDIDWVEFRIAIPDQIPERVVKFSKIVAQKNNLRVVRCKSGGQMIKEGWGRKIFELINRSYSHLYGFSPLTQRQIDHYVRMYLPIVRMELIALIADEQDNLVGFGISLPSLSKALQKSRGRMFPFGWFYMLRALKAKRAEVIDLMLIAVHPDYQNKGLTAIVMDEVMQGMKRVGAKWAESNPELESNETMQKQWEMFERRQHKRRRAYIKHLK